MGSWETCGCGVPGDHALAEPLVFAKGGHGGEHLTAVLALDLLTTVRVHSLMTTQVGELGVRFQANFALEWLDRAVDVLVLFETTGSCKGLATLGARVLTGTAVEGSQMSL